MLAKLGVHYVVCGHSERRTLFGETDEVVNRKVRAVLGHEMTPILCVGESLARVDAGQVAGMVIAYEPIWAIGTGRTATDGDANDMCGVVRRWVAERHGDGVAETVRVQYGGSVKPGNVRGLMRQPRPRRLRRHLPPPPPVTGFAGTAVVVRGGQPRTRDRPCPSMHRAP